MTIKSDSFNKNKTTIKKSDSVLSIMELILQCVLFESFILMEYMGVFLINDSRVYMCLWVIPAVIFAYYTRRKIKKFNLFMLCNIAIFAVSVVMSGNDSELFANMLCAILICAYSIWQKNNTVQRYSTENLIVQDGKTIDDAKKALAKMYAGEDIHVVFIAAPAFGYLVGYWRNVLPLMYIELTLCILFVVLKIIYNNMSHLNNVLSLNSKKNDFPAKQMKQVNTFITAASAILILFGMLMFYNGRYGGLFGVIGSSVTGVVRILVKGFLWLLGKSGPESSNTPQMDDETQEDIEDAMQRELEYPDSPIMQALFEGMVFAIIIAMIIAIIYMIRTYVKTFNKTKKLGSDYIEYISPDDENVRADKDVSKVKTKEPREVRSVRKLYKKHILKGTGGKTPDETVLPSVLTTENITADSELSEKITAVYEKARYSREQITKEEKDIFNNL